jgi:hypothetical protein
LGASEMIESVISASDAKLRINVEGCPFEAAKRRGRKARKCSMREAAHFCSSHLPSLQTKSRHAITAQPTYRSRLGKNWALNTGETYEMCENSLFVRRLHGSEVV